MARGKKRGHEEEHALPARRDDWGLGRKAVEIPTQRALEAMREEQLGEVARHHHAEARRIAERDVLPHAVVAGLCLREAKRRVRERGESWARWLESHWHMHEWSARQYMGAAETYLTLAESSGATPRSSAGVMETMAQAMKAIGCAELAKPTAREPRKSTAPPASPQPPPPSSVVDAEYQVIDREQRDQAYQDAMDAAELDAQDADDAVAARDAQASAALVGGEEGDEEPEPPAPATPPPPHHSERVPREEREHQAAHLDAHPLDHDAPAVLLYGFGYDEVLPREGPALGSTVVHEQAALLLLRLVYGRIDDWAQLCPGVTPGTRRAMSRLREALDPALTLAAELVGERCGDGSALRARAKQLARSTSRRSKAAQVDDEDDQDEED